MSDSRVRCEKDLMSMWSNLSSVKAGLCNRAAFETLSKVEKQQRTRRPTRSKRVCREEDRSDRGIIETAYSFRSFAVVHIVTCRVSEPFCKTWILSVKSRPITHSTAPLLLVSKQIVTGSRCGFRKQMSKQRV